ncbi:MAG TPA: hypothetical protein VHV75_04330 [Solirubrobacteraceae bacterium]|jgi:hypothetical protein|nr:hypothetical protein [Solirubrobacteraceae bacterium]
MRRLGGERLEAELIHAGFATFVAFAVAHQAHALAYERASRPKPAKLQVAERLGGNRALLGRRAPLNAA